MKWGFSVGGNVSKFSKKRNILRFKSMPAWTKQIQRLAIHEENGFLTFVHDQLSGRVKILTGMLPYEGAIIALIFDDFGNLRHNTTSKIQGFPPKSG
jgi:hypothetical protein